MLNPMPPMIRLPLPSRPPRNSTARCRGPAPAPTAPQAGNLAELSAQLREAAAEIAEIAAQAGRLGIAIDAAKALREGTTPEALRRLVLERASAAADARDIVAARPRRSCRRRRKARSSPPRNAPRHRATGPDDRRPPHRPTPNRTDLIPRRTAPAGDVPLHP
jgi:hypothetical protein